MPLDHEVRSGVAVCATDGHVRSLAQIEADVICLALSHYGGQISETARHLHIGRSTLYRKLEELGIDGSSHF